MAHKKYESMHEQGQAMYQFRYKTLFKSLYLINVVSENPRTYITIKHTNHYLKATLCVHNIRTTKDNQQKTDGFF